MIDLDTKAKAIEDILYRMANEGMSCRQACKESGIAAPTFFDWMKADPLLTERYARASEEKLEVNAAQIQDIADEEPNIGNDGRVDQGWIAWQRMRIDSRKWTLAKLKPHKYGDKIQTEHSGKLDIGVSFIEAKKPDGN